MAANGILQSIVVNIFKRILFHDALRPLAYLDKAQVHFANGINVHRLMNIPSGHTLVAFGLAIFLSLVIRNRIATFLLLSLATFVGLSRIYLLQHFIADVAIGAALGTVLVFIRFLFLSTCLNQAGG